MRDLADTLVSCPLCKKSAFYKHVKKQDIDKCPGCKDRRLVKRHEFRFIGMDPTSSFYKEFKGTEKYKRMVRLAVILKRPVITDHEYFYQIRSTEEATRLCKFTGNNAKAGEVPKRLRYISRKET